MIDHPHLTTTPAQLTACIALRVPVAQIMQVMGPGITELQACRRRPGRPQRR